MKKQTAKTASHPTKSNDSIESIYPAIISLMTLLIPIIILPYILDNAFEKPKNLIIFIGTSILVSIYVIQYFTNQRLPKLNNHTPKVVLLLVVLNLFSLLYTHNIYFTRNAVVLNISCLAVFYFLSIYLNQKWAVRLIISISVSGLFVALITILQTYGIFLFLRWLESGGTIPGTIGNSNYLGAYLIFPIYSSLSLFFLSKNKWLKIFSLLVFLIISAALIYTRARASWVGIALSLPPFLILMVNLNKISIIDFYRKNIYKIALVFIILSTSLTLLWFVSPKSVKKLVSIKLATDPETLRLRLTKYAPPAVWLIKQNPVFGTGLWSYRNLVYEAQAQLNKTDSSFFENYNLPKPRRVHNDYLEILVDGGLLAAFALLFFLLIVLKHGWKTIHNKDLPELDRFISAMAFSSIMAMLFTAFFFFPFRLNVTMFMTVLMMGLIEGIYNRHYGHISAREVRSSQYGWPFILIILFFISGLIWNMGLKPFIAERSYYRYKKTLTQRNYREAERFILKALRYDPHCTPYAFHSSQLYLNILKDPLKAKEYIDQSIIDFNGDLTLWSVYFYKGLINFRIGSLLEARSAFEQSLYYWPYFEPAKQKLAEINDIIEKHDRVMIKLR